MYAATNYVQATSTAPYHVVSSPSTCENTVPNAKFTTTDDNSSYPIVLHSNVTVTLDAPEIVEPPPRRIPIKKLPFQPPVREIARPWQAKWRLKQQRPRDGLFS